MPFTKVAGSILLEASHSTRNVRPAASVRLTVKSPLVPFWGADADGPGQLREPAFGRLAQVGGAEAQRGRQAAVTRRREPGGSRPQLELAIRISERTPHGHDGAASRRRCGFRQPDDDPA